ncbi:hypothetical protein [Massilia phosphatilytica]
MRHVLFYSPHVDAAKDAKTVAEKEAAMNSIIARLDVTSDKEKMFWSGNKDLAAKNRERKRENYFRADAQAAEVIDDWDELNKTFSRRLPKDMGPPRLELVGLTFLQSTQRRQLVGEIEIIQHF